MSLADDLEDLEPVHGNGVDRALEQLAGEDRAAWLGALDSGNYSSMDLSILLVEHSGLPVTDNQVRYYARKKGMR